MGWDGMGWDGMGWDGMGRWKTIITFLLTADDADGRGWFLSFFFGFIMGDVRVIVQF